MDRRCFLRLCAFAAASALTPKTESALAKEWSSAEQIELTLDRAKEIADNLASAFSPSSSVTAQDASFFIGVDGLTKGVTVEYSRAGSPAGYVILDSRCNGLVSDFSFGDGVISPFSRAASRISSSSSISSRSMVDIVESPYTYSVIDTHSGTIYNSDGRDTNLIDAGLSSLVLPIAKDPTTWSNVMISPGDLSKYASSSAGWSSDKIYYLTEDRCKTAFGRYACLVSAATLVSAFYGASSMQGTKSDYISLWERTYTTVDYTSNGVMYGLTNPSTGAAGCVDFCASKGVRIGQTTSLGSPNFTKFTECIDDGRCGMFHGGINVNNGGTIKRSGHTMMFQGYLKAVRKSDSKRVNLLVVADGWYEGFRCINYDNSYLTDKGGSFFWNN